MAILDDTRSDWNARPPLRPRTVVPWADRIGVSWHWIGPGKGPSAAGPHSACLTQVREWQRQHQANGWKDLGYNALICQHGRAIEGRGLEFSGSHSPGVNTVHVGVQFMVGDASGGITPVMVARAQRLRYDIGRLGKNIRRDWGHRDDPKASTACPGNAIHAWVHSGAPTQYAPAPTTAPAQQEDDDMPTPADLWQADIIPSPDKAESNPTWQPDSYLRETFRLLRTVSIELGALRGVVSALAANGDMTAEQVTAAAKAGAAAALDEKIADATTVLGVKS